MFKNYLRITYRNIVRHKSFSIINILGLALGIACCILIIAFIGDELTYDKFHENGEQIYRMKFWGKLGGGTMDMPVIPGPIGEVLKDDFPEVIDFVRFRDWSRPMLSYEDKRFFEDNTYFADNVFNIFSFNLIKGDPKTALENPNTIVMTPEAARKYFGDEDPMGKALRHNNERDLLVTGIIEPPPSNSHIDFDMLISMETFKNIAKGEFGQSPMAWLSFNHYTYLLMDESTDLKEFERKVNELMQQKVGMLLKQVGGEIVLSVQPMLDIHLQSNLRGEMEINGDMKYVYSFAGIALFILLIACINFMNLSTARSANRAKEVGLRKVLGAFRKQLAKQFFGESIIFSLISLIIALILAEIALPFFNDLSGKEININYLNMPWLIIAIIGVVVFTGIIAGSYPALLLSAFKPVQVLKGSIKQGVKSSKFRSVLVVTQFAISITLIIGTTIVYNQLNYMRNKELGFDKEKLLVLELPDDNRAERYEMIKSEILQFEAVTNAAVSSLTPAGGNNSTALVPEGYENNMQIFLFNIYSVDQDFTDTYGIEIVQGRDISKDLISDKGNVCLVNETAVKQIEAWNDAIGKKLYRTMDANMTNLVSYEVVGVFKDFHTHRLYQPIEPTVFYFDAKDFDDITLKLKTENMSETLDIIKNKWAEIDPSKPFEYSFIDDRFYNQYRTEEKLGNIFRTFTFIAIFIGCLGLFGLASFITEQRTKEIGIRKTLGSSITTIIYLLCKDFIKLIVLSNVIAWPAAYFLMKNWLTKFPYQTEMSILAFMLAAIATLVIALLTVSYQSVKAAAANPMDSLRYE